jgi:hypothetical protein
MDYNKTKLEAIHKQATDRYAAIEDSEKESRKLAIEDLRFAHAPDGQWDENAIEKRKNSPRYTINRVAGAIDQITGDQRQTRTMIKVVPNSGGADEDRADIFNGLIRSIEANSKAENAYDCAFDEMVTGGYGGWRVYTEYNDDDSFEQDIKIEGIGSAASSLFFDPSAKEYDKRDAMYAFVTTKMTTEVFKEKYPDAQVVSVDQVQHSTGNKGWYDDDGVIVAEYWVKEPYIRTIALLSDGRVIDKEEESKVLDELALTGTTVVKERKAQSHKIKSYIMSGSEILKGPMNWAGKFIPLVPVYGKVINIEGKRYVRGLVRNAKDPSRIYNYATSASIEAAALSPKDPIWHTPTQAKGHARAWRLFNTGGSQFMPYNPDPQAPGIPQRTGAPAVQAALIQQIQQAAMDIHSTTGIEPASLGNSPELKSGKAILAQQAMGDRGSFLYSDNLTKSKEYTGEILIDLIPKTYDSDRIVRTLGLDGTSGEETHINMPAVDEFNQPIVDQQTGEQVIVNDLTVGKYSVVAETGPAFNTQRQESAQQLIDLARDNEFFGTVATDLIAKNLNILENDELTKRVRRMMIQQGIVEPTEEEIEELGLNQPPPPDPAAVALTTNVEMQTEKMMSDITIQEAEQERKNIETQAKIQKQLDELALKLTEMEQAAGKQLNQEVVDNTIN